MATSPSVSEVTMKRGLASPLGPLGLGDDAPLAAPALAGRPGKVPEATRRLTGLLALLLRRGQLGRHGTDEALVPRQAEDAHQSIEGKP